MGWSALLPGVVGGVTGDEEKLFLVFFLFLFF
jgi:hypothetical protein